MSYPYPCPGCSRGDHSQHDPDHGVIPGVIGGSQCGCKGNCRPRPLPEVSERSDSAPFRPIEAPFLPESERSCTALHVMPVADLVEHDPAEDCPCGPATEPVMRADGSNGWLHTHHSLDRRETP